MYLAIDGVACTTKSTILQRLNADDRYCVHMSDYKEVCDMLKLGADRVLDGMVYIMHRLTLIDADKLRRNVFDREPASSVLYRLVFDDATPETINKYCNIILKTGINKKWRSIILLPCDGQDHLVVEMMKKRNNGYDWMDLEYVQRQRKVFKIWAFVMGYDVFYIDYTKDLTVQQDEIIAKIHDLFG